MSAALVVLALLPLAGALLPALAVRRLAYPVAATVVGATLVLDAWLLYSTPAAGATVLSLRWVPALDLTLALRLDRLSGATALVVALFGLGALWRLKRNPGREPFRGRDGALLVLFVGLTQALALAENALVLAAVAELGALAAFALERDRGGGEHRPRAALYLRSAGSLALLAAALLVADTAGSFEFGSVFAAGASIRAHALFPLLLALVLGAAWSRAAAWPWNGRARGAPAGSGAAAGFTGAVLFASGVYLAARFWPLVQGALPLAVVGGGFVVAPFLIAALERAVRAVGVAEDAADAATAAAVGEAHE